MERYREHAPHPTLAPYVACYWTSERGGEPRAVMPDGCIDLLFDEVNERLSIVGTMTRALWVEPHAHARFAGVRFLPGGAVPFLRERADTLTDRVIDATDVIGRGAQDLKDRLHERDPVQTLEAFLLARRVDRVDPRVAHAAAILTRDPSRPIETLTDELAMTRQHVRRIFLNHVGVSPKAFARNARLSRLVPLLGDGSLASAAAVAGYSDQAHMTREFHRAVGTSPARWLAAR